MSHILRLLPVVVCCLLTACQSLPPQPLATEPHSDSPPKLDTSASLPEPEPEPTALETHLASLPIPPNPKTLKAECLRMAELYSTSMVAKATWFYAQTPNKPSLNDLEAALRASKARAERLGCPDFWNEP